MGFESNIMENILKKLQETKEYIQSISDCKPELGIIFGSGLSSDELLDNVEAKIDYKNIPNFPISTVENHKGELIIGQKNKKNIFIFSGRFHFYEGYSGQEITYPVRLLQYYGTENLILTNAAGGINPEFNAGDIILIKDHINMIPGHPLRGKNHDFFGTRFPDMSNAYNKEIRKQFLEISAKNHIPLKEGVYLALQGPSLETPAEYTMIYRLGADLIGMSTVFETIVAVHGGMNVAGFSVVSNECYPPERISETTHQEVVRVVSNSEPKLMKLIAQWIDNYL